VALSSAGGCTVSLFGYALGFGLVTAAIVGFSAVALSLQFSVSRIPNFAHGTFLTMGAYGGLVAQHLTDNIVFDALVAAAFGGITALAINRFILQSFVRARVQLTILLVVTVGVGLVLENVIAVLFGNRNQVLVLPHEVAHDIGPFRWTSSDIVIMVAALAAMTALYLTLRFTWFGKAQRAVADSRELADITGIKVEWIVQLTWLIAGALAGLAGLALAAKGGSFGPQLGFNFLLVTFAAAIVGGIGKPYGALAGALIIGLVTEVSALYVDASYKQVAALLVLIIALFVRPNGLFTTVRGDAKA
jgi:neutral amino acid transport system permease protein